MQADALSIRRVNARLDESFMVKLDYLRAATAMSVSDIVKVSLNHYYETVQAELLRKKNAMLPYIGKYASGNADGSVRYKEWIAASLDQKMAREPEATYDTIPRKARPGAARKVKSAPKPRGKR